MAGRLQRCCLQSVSTPGGVVSLTAYSLASKKVTIPSDSLFNAINTTQAIYWCFRWYLSIFLTSSAFKKPSLNTSGPVLAAVLVSRTGVPEIVFILHREYTVLLPWPWGTCQGIQLPFNLGWKGVGPHPNASRRNLTDVHPLTEPQRHSQALLDFR